MGKYVTRIRRDYGDGWQETSRAVRQRDGCCQKCGSTVNLQVHHIKPLSRGGSNKRLNLITLCSGCHAKQHKHLH